MSNVDTSMYSTGQGSGMMGGASQLMGILGGLRQQQLFQTQLAAKGAAGQAFLGAGDPSDPGFFSKFQQGIQQTGNPYAASMAPEMLTQARQAAMFSAQQQSAQQEAIAKHLENMQRSKGLLGQALGSMATDPNLQPGGDPKKGAGALIGAVGLLNAQDPQSFPLSDLMPRVKPYLDSTGQMISDPAGLQRDIAQFAAQTEQGRNALAAVQPKWEMQQGAHGLVPIQTNPTHEAIGGYPVGMQKPGSTPIPTVASSTPVTFPTPSGATAAATPGQIAAGGTQLGATASAAVTPPSQIESPGQDQGLGGGTEGPGTIKSSLMAQAGQRLTDLGNDVDRMHAIGQRANQMQQLLANTPVGGLTAQKTQIANIAYGLLGNGPQAQAAADAIVGGGPGSFQAATTLAKDSLVQAMSELHSSIGGSGRYNQFIEDQFLRATPNLNTPADAFNKMMDLSAQIAKLKSDELRGYTGVLAKSQEKGSKIDPTLWPGEWENFLIRHNKNGYADWLNRGQNAQPAAPAVSP